MVENETNVFIFDATTFEIFKKNAGSSLGFEDGRCRYLPFLNQKMRFGFVALTKFSLTRDLWYNHVWPFHNKSTVYNTSCAQCSVDTVQLSVFIIHWQ